MKNFLALIFTFLITFIYCQCTHTIRLTDTYGDGWNGGAVSVSVNGVVVLNNINLFSGFGPANFNFTASSGQTIRVYRTLSGSWPTEMRVQIVNNIGTVLLPTIQPATGTSTTGGHTCVANCTATGFNPCASITALNCGVSTTFTVAAGNGSYNPPTTTCGFSTPGQERIFQITPTISGNYTISQPSSFGYIDWFYKAASGGCNGTGWTCIDDITNANGGNANVNIPLTAGITYYIMADPEATTGGNVTFTLNCPAPPPANNLVCNATNIVCGQIISGTTVNATNSGTGENLTCSVSQTQPGVWYRVTGNGQIMTAYLCNTAWDSKISVFTGPNCSTLSCVGGNDDNGPSCTGNRASYQWQSVNSTVYYILVHGFSTTSAFQLGLTCTNPPPPNPTSISATLNTICNGQTTTLTANGASGTVYWYTGGCGITQVASGNTLTVSPTTTTTYWIRNFNGTQFSTGCAQTTITVNQNPVASASATQSPICSGSSTQLNGSFTGVTSPGQLVVTITGGLLDETSWTLTNSVGTIIGSGGPYFSSPNTINIGSSANGPYSFFIETIGSWNDNVPTFTITCNGTTVLNNSIVGGTSNTFAVSTCTTVPAATYLWSPSTGLSNANASSPLASPTSTQTYQLTVTANGCSSTASTTVTVNPSVGTISNISGNNTIIAGTQETYSITPVAGVTYLWSYTESMTAPLWNNIPNSNSSSVTFTWPPTTSDGAVRVTVSNSFGCGTQVKIMSIIVNGVLPVELLTFDGSCDGEKITIEWQTASEHNSDYFEVLKSRDGQNWNLLTKIPAAGNSTQVIDYSVFDTNKLLGLTYYKLLQVDIDGKSKEYGPILVSCTETSKGYFSVFPNPTSGQFQIIINDYKLIGNSKLIIRDTKGSEILTKNLEIKPGINSIYVEDLEKSSGMYYIYIINDELTTTIKKIEIK